MCTENAQAKERALQESALLHKLDDRNRRRTEPRPIDEELCNIAYERGQIGERIRKLEAAIKANPEAVSEYHKGLWKIQLDAMEGYYNALGERIKDFIAQTERK